MSQLAPPPRWRVGVRALCEFAARRGDLDLRFTPVPTARQGLEGHRLVAERRGPDWQAEVPLQAPFEDAAGVLQVSGRADGVDLSARTVEEVKTVRGALPWQRHGRRAGVGTAGSPFDMPDGPVGEHVAQLRVYGWMLCRQEGWASVRLQLSYVDVVDGEVSSWQVEAPVDALREHFERLARPFLGWCAQESAHRRTRDAALRGLAFPAGAMRPGQRTLAEAVWRHVMASRPAAQREGPGEARATPSPEAEPHVLRAQAPTGVGKTLGTLFPMLRAMPEAGLDRIIYLTARTTGRAAALQELRRIVGLEVPRETPGDPAFQPVGDGLPTPPPPRSLPLPLRVLEMPARASACEHPQLACHGQSCPLARGFFDRLPAARQDAAAAGWLDAPALAQIARQHAVCPYYLGQEMTRWSDVAVGDLNRWFDRHAGLHALAQERGWAVGLLVDEAHQLVPRARAMHSDTWDTAELEALGEALPRALRRLLQGWLVSWDALVEQARAGTLPELEPARGQDEPDEPRRPGQADRPGPAEAPTPRWWLLREPPVLWRRGLQRLATALSAHLDAHPPESGGPVLTLHFRVLAGLALVETWGEHSQCELEVVEHPQDAHPTGGLAFGTRLVRLSLRNVVPAPFVRPRLAAARASVLFSATLPPPDFDQALLGLPAATPSLAVPYPFDTDNLQVRVLPLSTRWADRRRTLTPLVDAMARAVAEAPGNWLAFFSSFDYLEAAERALRRRHPSLRLHVQQRSMGEAERRDFLDGFQPGAGILGLAVLGGVFSEGVDLPGERLIGAFVLTLGLPQPTPSLAAEQRRLDAWVGPGGGETGWRYACLIPGLQKVVQAAGRVVRTDTDRGTVVLVDDRYGRAAVRALLPPWWGLGTRRDSWFSLEFRDTK